MAFFAIICYTVIENKKSPCDRSKMKPKKRDMEMKSETPTVKAEANRQTEHEPHTHHAHSHEKTKAVINRMNRAIGHMESVKTMIEDGRDCSEVLIQIAAVRSAINNIGKLILEDHISHCVVDAIETGDEQVLKDLNDAINKFIK